MMMRHVIYFIYHFVRSFFWPLPAATIPFFSPPPTPPPPTADDIYKDKHVFVLNDNRNVEACFSHPIEYRRQVAADKNNLLEQTWRRRLMLVATPRGGVLMYYDAFKRGFAYYADAHMPYGILNAVAKQYVARYFCSAFFIDEEEFPPGYTSSPLLDPELDDPSTAPSNKRKSLTGSAFLSKVPPTAASSKTASSKNESTPEKRKNRFVNMGKIVNHSILQTVSSSGAPLPIPPASAYKFWKSQRHNTTEEEIWRAIA